MYLAMSADELIVFHSINKKIIWKNSYLLKTVYLYVGSLCHSFSEQIILSILRFTC